MLNNESIRFERVVIFAVSYPVVFRKWAAERNDPSNTYKEGLGHENGKEEPIFLTLFDNMAAVVMAGFLEDQDFVIILDPQEPVVGGRRMAFSLDSRNNSEPLGLMTEVGEIEALAGDVWSRFTDDTGLVHYYVAKPVNDNVKLCGWKGVSEEEAEGFSEPTKLYDIADSGLRVDGKTLKRVEPAKSPLDDFDKPLDLASALTAVFGAGNVHILETAEDVEALYRGTGIPRGEPETPQEPVFAEPVEPVGCGERYRRGIDAQAAVIAETVARREANEVKSPPKSCLERYAPSFNDEPFKAFEKGTMIGTLGDAPTAHMPLPINGDDPHIDGGTIFGDTTAVPDPHAPATLDPDSVDAKLAKMRLDIDGLRDTVRILETVIKNTHYNAWHRVVNGGYMSVG